MRLINGKIGKCYFVVKIDLEDGVRRRFEMLGMTVGTKILILNSKKSGSMIIKIRGTRFAIGRCFASGIEVNC